MSANIELFTLTSAGGVAVRVTNYGGIITSILAPDRHGHLADIVLGHDTVDHYRENPAYLGAIIGRYANRIAGARFALDGTTHQLAANDGPHSLHGGRHGFDQATWTAEAFHGPGAVGVVLSHLSPDGEEGFPGTLATQATYTLTDGNELAVEYLATTDRATPVNLSQHSYFNLADAGDVLGHLLEISAEVITPVDETLIPTGDLMLVAGTPFDFRQPRRIGDGMAANDPQIQRGRGYDHNFVLTRDGPGLVRAARLMEPDSGRTLEVFTTEPGMQLYTGNHLDGRVKGKGGRAYGPHAGLCLETQHFPDSPNQPGFPSTILRPGVVFRSKTVFRFGGVGSGF